MLSKKEFKKNLESWGHCLNKEDFEIILKDIGIYLNEIILSCGYEPLTSKNFMDIISFISQAYPHIKISFCTNALLMDSKIRTEIIKNKIDSITISMDGVTRKTYEHIRKGSNYERVISNILALNELKKQYSLDYPKIIINYVIMNSNMHEAQLMVRLGKLIGAKLINFRKIAPFNQEIKNDNELLDDNKAKFNFYREKIIEESERHKIPIHLADKFDMKSEFTPLNNYELTLNDFSKIMPDKNEKIFLEKDNFKKKKTNNIKIKSSLIKKYLECIKNIFKIKNSSFYCTKPFNEMFIDLNYNIKPCECSSIILGNLKEDNLINIIFGEKFNQVRQNIFKNKGDPGCKNCFYFKRMI